MDSNSPNQVTGVSVDTEGNVLRCAKGLGSAECGYSAGSPVCGKCGALPIEMKVLPAEEYDILQKALDMKAADEAMASMEEEPKKKKPRPRAMEDAMTEDDETAEVPYEEEEEEEETEEESMPEGERAAEENAEGEMADEDESEQEDGEDEDLLEDEEVGMMQKFRQARLSQMGIKSIDAGIGGYKCAMDKKVYPGGTPACASCKGGCTGTKGQMTLLHAEGYAQTLVKGEVVDSGYVPNADMYVVGIQRKDGKTFDVFINGTTGIIHGHRLTDSYGNIKTKSEQLLLITFDEAGDIATKSVQGEVIAIEPDSFEGIDSYAVEIEGIDGKSYDVFVSLDGEVLGYDKYDPTEAEEIEAEAAEIALKRAFSEESRQELAESGIALPDGSYPIKTEGDLKNAIQAYGRAKDKEAAKRHIMKRARALGLEKLIPSNWVMSQKDETANIEDEDFKRSLLEFQLLSEESQDI
jgi:hypothetical protein